MAIQLRESIGDPRQNGHASGVAEGVAVAAPPSGEVVVHVRGYGRSFAGRTVLSGVDLELVEGELVALLGASGSGKSTLLRALAGQDRGAEGHVRVPRERAVAFQDHRLLPWKRVWRNVVLGLPGRASRANAIRALEEVGIAGRADAWPGTLSGGESQRVALARAFVRHPRLLLLDEPFGALDALTRLKMHALLRQLLERHRPATLLVTHDVDEAISLADRILVLSGGHISLDHRNPASDRRGPEALVLRTRLLEELGVYTPEPSTTN
jgi:sulfonate transport system ATP-binding protein